MPLSTVRYAQEGCQVGRKWGLIENGTPVISRNWLIQVPAWLPSPLLQRSWNTLSRSSSRAFCFPGSWVLQHIQLYCDLLWLMTVSFNGGESCPKHFTFSKKVPLLAVTPAIRDMMSEVWLLGAPLLLASFEPPLLHLYSCVLSENFYLAFVPPKKHPPVKLIETIP